MAKFVFFITSLISKLQQTRGGGTSFPGKIALKLKPDILTKFKLPEERVFVSGTNGKTSTANYLAEIFAKSGKKVCHNTAGANLKQGITTTLLNCANSNLELQSDLLVLEIDELSMPPIFTELDPQNLVFTNLFNDQIDRTGDKWQLAKILAEKLPSGLNLYINGDDPVLVWLSQQIKPNKVVYFGIEAKNSPELESSANLGNSSQLNSSANLGNSSQLDNFPNFPNSPEYCPYCNSELHYDVRFYESLGKFNCPCGFTSPKLDYAAKDLNLSAKNFFIENQNFQMPFSQLYLAYNMLAAITFSLEKNIDSQLIADVLENQASPSGRFEYLDFNNYPAWLNLVKNPAGINQSLSFLREELKNSEVDKQKINLLLAFNNLHADGLDYSWLEQANFELLNSDNLSAIYLSGSLHEVVMNLLIKKGIPREKIIFKNELLESIAEMKTGNMPCYFLSNFTMLKSVREGILKA